MRLLILALMIALLPLRGWVGDAMAMEMIPGHCMAMKNIVDSPHSTGARGHFHTNSKDAHSGCSDPIGTEVAVSADDSAPQGAATHGHCSNSSACLVYQAVAVVTSVHFHAPASHSHLVWPAGGVPFASASLAPSLKPPIS